MPESDSRNDPLAPFSAPVRRWFESSFEAPTPAQTRGWQAIPRARNTLICAPTGLGQDPRSLPLGDRPPRPEPGAGQGVRLVYVSPLKALSYDIERNLRAPLRGSGPRRSRWACAPATRPRRSARRCGVSPRHPDHHTGVALPDALLRRPRDPRHGARRDRRRDPRRRPVQARRPPRAHPRAPRLHLVDRRRGRRRRASSASASRRRSGPSSGSAGSSSARSGNAGSSTPGGPRSSTSRSSCRSRT